MRGVSVIIPAYNEEKSIIKSIESVLNQTYSPIEVIVVDDASTDATEKMVRTVNDDRVSFYRKEINEGPSAARNYGISVAKYDYIAFQDGDDYWDSNKLQKQIKKFEENDEYGMVYCAYLYEDGKKNKKIPSDIYKIDELDGWIFDSLWKSNKIGTPTMLFKKELLMEIGLFNVNLKSLEDWELALRFSSRFAIGYVNEVLVYADYTSVGVNGRKKEQIDTLIHLMDMFPMKEKACRLDEIFSTLVGLDEKNCHNTKEKLFERGLVEKNVFNVCLRIGKKEYEHKTMLNVAMKLSDKQAVRQWIDETIKTDEIAIYGAGPFGLHVARCLQENGCNIRYIIDSNYIEDKNYNVINPLGDIKEITKVIITVRAAIWENDLNKIYYRDGVDCINIFDMQ